MKFEFYPTGVCSKKYIFEIEDNILKNVEILNGCPGNLKGISNLLAGMSIDDVIDRFEGITCGLKTSSCPDQIAKALKEYKNNQ